MRVVSISSLYHTLDTICDSIGKLYDDDDEVGYEYYMIALEETLGWIFDSDIAVVSDEEYEELPTINPYLRLIENLRYLTRNGRMHPIVDIMIRYVEDFIYGGN